jgi:predicted permease
MPNNLAYDLKHAVRGLARDRGFTTVVLLSLALGIGANTSIFSLVDQVLVQRLPAKRPQELVLLSWEGSFPGRWWGRTSDGDLLSHPLYRELGVENRDRLHVFDELFARKPATAYLDGGAGPEPAPIELVSGTYFSALGVGSALGRVLDESDDQRPGEHPVVVLSFDYWKNRLGGPADILGRKLVVNSRTFTVVGVAAAGFRGTDPVEAPALWMPTMMQQQAGPEYGAMIEDRRAKWLHVFARLAPGVTPAQARASLQPWFKAMLDEDTRRSGWPNVSEAERGRFLASTLEVAPAAQGRSDQRAVLERPLLILLGATGLILLLACLNVANLLLARAFARRRELAVRAALGASGGRIARDLALQTGLLALGGAAAGVLLAPWVTRLLLRFVPETVTLSAALNLRVLLFALGATLLTGVLFGLWPALQAGRSQPAQALKEQAAGVAGGLHLRRVLVIGQIALALMLLIGAGLFARTLASLRAQTEIAQPGLLTFRIDTSKGGVTPAHAKQKVVDLLAAVRALPEVETAGLSRLPLMSGGGFNMRFTVGPGSPIETGEVGGYFVSPGLFGVLGVPLVAGRDLRDPVEPRAPDAEFTSAIVNESFVARYLPGRNPVGARLAFGVGSAKPPTIEIVGVVKDFHYRGLRGPEVQVFFPALEKPLQGATLFVRTRGPAQAAFAAMQAAVHRVDPALPVLGLRTLDQQIDSALVTERLLATLAAAFAALAVLLAIVGLYGLMSFVVTRRTREIGIRLALGASPARAMALIVREAGALLVAGFVIGLPAVWTLGRLIESQLFGVHATDSATAAGAAALLALAAFAGSALPARRASAVNAMAALKAE